MIKQTIARVMIVAIAVILLGYLGYQENTYTRDGVVVEISGAEVTVEDEQGNLWSFNGTDYRVNQQVRLTMHTNTTDSIIEDDIVKEATVL